VASSGQTSDDTIRDRHDAPMDVVLVTVTLLVVLGGAVWWSKRKPARRRMRLPPTLHDAARRGNVDLLAERVRDGGDLDVLDTDDNTPLHLAYFENRSAAVAWLIEHGAEQQRPNRYGFIPAEMRRFAEVVRLVRRGADALTPVGSVSQPIGTSLPEQLRAAPVEMYLAAVERLVTVDPARRRVLLLAIKLGIPGTEKLLCDLLWSMGDQPTAEAYLNSGSPALRACSQRWAATHLYDIIDGRGHHYVTWGIL
jgi:ankyrin repeat protein